MGFQDPMKSITYVSCCARVVQHYTLHYKFSAATSTMTATTVPMSIRLDASARERLKAIAERQKRSPHALATEAIHQLIEQKEREHAWHQSCEDALKHFDETGRHATHEEVMQWMDRLATDQDAPPPGCHQ